MPLQARKFTDEERNAVVRAVLVDGMTQVGAIRAAEAGELIEGRSFTIARGTLQGYLKRAIGDPAEGIQPDQVRAQLLSALKREIDAELPKLEGRRKLDFITQALHAVNAAKWETAKVRKAKEEKNPPPEDDLRSESLERLAAAHSAEGDGTAQTNAHTEESESGEQPPVARGETMGAEVEAVADGRVPIAAVESGLDSRVPSELAS